MTKKVIILIAVVGGVLVLLFGCILLVMNMLVTIALPGFYSATMKYANNTLAESILQSLQSSASIYAAQQKTVPKKFSDFVSIDLKEDEIKNTHYTITLEHIKEAIKEPDSQEDLAGNTFEMAFKTTSLKAKYYLKGTQVSAEYFNNAR